ncbi:MAG: hypothetical protein DME18_10420 [Verrucomicrobia bacterium]|nr:MAG: hypothetical protein DME18_10420 [Verrucomicrobiota bacterium]
MSRISTDLFESIRANSCNPCLPAFLALVFAVWGFIPNPVAVARQIATSKRVNHNYWAVFAELIATPFRHVETIWGIVPLYFALLLNEMTSAKASYRTAIQTGFSFLWAGAQWLYPYFRTRAAGAPRLELDAMLPINLAVTFLAIALGAAALVSGIRRTYPKYGSFLGHTRFSNYFMITIFPMQAHLAGMNWTWERLIAITLFAAPIWLLLHFGLMPIRNRT